MWRPIRLRWVNLALLLLVAGLALGYGRELAWAWDVLPGYLRESIPSPRERKDYRRAQRLLRRDDPDYERILRLLQRSIAVDPHGEGYYWLGRYHLQRAELEPALDAFERYVEIDPTQVGCYLSTAEIHVRRGATDEARAALERGLEYYQRRVEEFTPRLDPSVDERFNRKAEETYALYRTAIATLRQELAGYEPPETP